VRDLHARRIVGFGLTSADADRLTEFYVMAFGARQVSSEHLSGAGFERRMGVSGGALRHTIEVGRESVDVIQFDMPGRPYPQPLSPIDTVFQHFAIVVSDMDQAMSQLQRSPGWVPISSGGPQRLPASSGGVTAFKFQDPEGHPLELLAFPKHGVPARWRERLSDGIFLGIDHSAISVRDTATSKGFYQALGFVVTSQTLNHGEAQANLDGVPSPEVEVTALSLGATTPHLELLCYQSEVRPPHRALAGNDAAATRILLAADGLQSDVDAAPRLLVDPDGHHLLLVD
jgi:catechol 2,3-dioxygenase-like lactoylglutathione lyase family enzyme